MDTLISANGEIYDMIGFDEDVGLYKVAIVDIDEEGLLTSTLIPYYLSKEDLENKEIKLTEKQWMGMVCQMIGYYYALSEEEIDDAANDIVGRCFAITGTPLIENLFAYIKEYMQI